jgi:hypothetical protein
MNFYQAYYKRQYNNGSGGWRDTAYRHQSLFVIANNHEEAKDTFAKMAEIIVNYLNKSN